MNEEDAEFVHSDGDGDAEQEAEDERAFDEDVEAEAGAGRARRAAPSPPRSAKLFGLFNGQMVPRANSQGRQGPTPSQVKKAQAEGLLAARAEKAASTKQYKHLNEDGTPVSLDRPPFAGPRNARVWQFAKRGTKNPQLGYCDWCPKVFKLGSGCTTGAITKHVFSDHSEVREGS
jgi:hypothetical protein